MDGAYVGQVAALRVFHIAEQCTCSGDGDRESAAAKTVEVSGLELSLQIFPGTGLIEAPVGLATQGAVPWFVCEKTRLGHQNFCRRKPRDFGLERHCICDFGHEKAPAAEIQPRQSVARLVHRNGENQRILACLQQRLVSQCAGRHNAHHLAIDRPFARCGITNLLGDGD